MMKANNYLALKDALSQLNTRISACEESHPNRSDHVDKNVLASARELLHEMVRVLDDEITPEIIKMQKSRELE
ncbi:MAG: hypothetical protein QM221_04705 [Bacillota bacterium]|jgi:hypothetical protein|nr:hypothetical protein [Bacillota bacterium]